jgi:hypothetical protein
MPTVKDELLQKDIEAYFRADADLRAGLVELTPGALTQAILGFVAAMKEAGVTLSDARFADVLREYATTLRAQRRSTPPVGLGTGIVARAACRAGLVEGLTEAGVGDLKPWEVKQISDRVDNIISAAFDIPKA